MFSHDSEIDSRTGGGNRKYVTTGLQWESEDRGPVLRSGALCWVRMDRPGMTGVAVG